MKRHEFKIGNTEGQWNKCIFCGEEEISKVRRRKKCINCGHLGIIPTGDIIGIIDVEE